MLADQDGVGREGGLACARPLRVFTPYALPKPLPKSYRCARDVYSRCALSKSWMVFLGIESVRKVPRACEL